MLYQMRCFFSLFFRNQLRKIEKSTVSYHHRVSWTNGARVLASKWSEAALIRKWWNGERSKEGEKRKKYAYISFWWILLSVYSSSTSSFCFRRLFTTQLWADFMVQGIMGENYSTDFFILFLFNHLFSGKNKPPKKMATRPTKVRR